MKCPCGSKQSYEDCCKKVHDDIKNALTAEQLMRSRYSAFTLGLIDYLMESHHQSTRPIEEKDEILAWTKSVEWVGLDVLHKQKGGEGDAEGMVEFKAFFKEGKKTRVIHERSRFVKENGSWYYVDAL